jgi:dTDP-glucose pyrophosphorylase/CBS domain-containing protein
MKIITNLNKLIIDKNLQLKEILIKINEGQEAVLLVVEHNKLLGVITDGDIRREIISNGDTSSSKAFKIMNKNPVTASDDASMWSDYFINNDIEHLPIVDSKNNLIRIIRNVKNTDTLYFRNTVGLIVAGGLGSRMGEKYSETPKCLIKIKEKTILERSLQKLSNLNLDKIIISVKHQHEKIIDFVNNSEFKNKIDFFIEENSLGTAGSLVSLSKEYKDKDFFVFNSDIIFDLDFFNLNKFFRDTETDLLICTAQYEIEIPYGVLEKETIVENDFEIIEKPRLKYDVVAGIYYVKKNIFKDINQDSIEMDELILRLKENSRKINYFNIGSNWIDIGNEKQIDVANRLPFIN